jgi:HAD domain in Swiss Army Knife RNA repair proteins
MRQDGSNDTESLQMRLKPLLLVDIDGVLSLFGFPSTDRPAGSWISVDGILHLISATASEHLHRLAQRFELVWCSGWEEKANEFLLAPLSLPRPLPFLTFSAQVTDDHWKLAAITAYAGTRPLAWIDDAHDDRCRAWAAARAAPTLLVSTSPATGLTAAHVATLEAWAASLP